MVVAFVVSRGVWMSLWLVLVRVCVRRARVVLMKKPPGRFGNEG